MGVSSEIPFLRTQYAPMDFSKTHTQGFNGYGTQQSFFSANRSRSDTKHRAKAKNLKRIGKKEAGWQGYIKPISTYNTQVHPSMRIPFE